jgi:hypothetical protein
MLVRRGELAQFVIIRPARILAAQPQDRFGNEARYNAAAFQQFSPYRRSVSFLGQLKKVQHNV